MGKEYRHSSEIEWMAQHILNTLGQILSTTNLKGDNTHGKHH